MEKLDLRDVVRDATEIISFEQGKAGVKIRFVRDSEVAIVQGDRVLLEPACINLIMNAFESMSDIPIAKRELVIRTTTDKDRVHLSFRDTGCGILESIRNQVFDAFFTPKEQGVGVGLSLCQSIAESHTGVIAAEPNHGPGVTFVLTLPRYTSVSKR